jgi:SAM-dependent methyltransferase
VSTTQNQLAPAEFQGASSRCRICGNDIDNNVYSVREMMLGLRDTFHYLECKSCGCLQLLDGPEDFARFYPANYTAYRQYGPKNPALRRLWLYLRKRRNHGFLQKGFSVDRMLTGRYEYLQLRAFARLEPDRKTRILDVGCGGGMLVKDLREQGYSTVLGIDRYIPQTINDANGVLVLKGTLSDLNSASWDIVMFHHSFEHMPDQADVLRQAAQLLPSGGRCLIRIPVLGWAWTHYGVNWSQLDAPRHLYLHSEKSFCILCEESGLQLQDVIYDSNEFQFWASELYSRDIDLASVNSDKPQTVFPKSEMQKFKSEAKRLNSERRGDSAIFILRKP